MNSLESIQCQRCHWSSFRNPHWQELQWSPVVSVKWTSLWDEACCDSLGGEEAFQVARYEQSDLIRFRGLAVPSADLQDAPACTGQGVVQVPVGIPFFVQHPLLQHHRLVLLVPIGGGWCHFWRQKTRVEKTLRRTWPSKTGEFLIKIYIFFLTDLFSLHNMYFLLLTIKKHAFVIKI